jgi:rhodanese-related sulfurtransferase
MASAPPTTKGIPMPASSRPSPLAVADMVASARRHLRELTPAQVQAAVAAGAALVDVREPAEFAEGHIAGAANLPRGVLEFQVEAHPALACRTAEPLALRDRPLIVYCRTGGRAALAADSLGRMGFSAVSSLSGGVLGWQDAGLPLERGT